MKRRRFVQALAALPVAAPLAAQPPQGVTPANNSAQPGPAGRAAASPDENPKLETAVGESVADAMPKFFTPAQLGALRKVSDLLVPASAASPGALASGAPEFLDFLIGASGPDRQMVYRAGLDGLNAQSRRQFGKLCGDIDNKQADALMAPLNQPWTYAEPADPVAHFLRVAKADVRTATQNSKASGTGRRFAGSGLYWYPLD